MNFELTREQKAIQKAVREFAEGEFDKDVALEHETSHSFPRELWRKACELGFVCINFPEAYGGQEYGLLESTLVAEELCRRDSGLGSAIMLANFGADFLLRYGSEEQKARWLPTVVSGQSVGGAAFTEPERGTELADIRTVAIRDSETWVIDGTKSFITNGTIADFVVVLCQTDATASLPEEGLSTILVETDRPGFMAAGIHAKVGLKMTGTADLTLTRVRVPLSNLVGQEGQGYGQALGFLETAKISTAARAVGMAQGSLDRALTYAKLRHQFNRPLVDFQAIQHKLADMDAMVETARLIVYKAAWTFDQGRLDPRLSSLAKMYAARAAVLVCEEAIQIFGGHGYIQENEVERFYRDVRITEILESSRETQKNTVAAHVIGRSERLAIM